MILRTMTTLLILPLCLTAAKEKHPLPDTERKQMQAGFREAIGKYTQALKESPKEVGLYSRRGDVHLFSGNFREAVKDFEKMIELDPSQDAPHWRLGIAYYYINNFKKGMDQFAKYHAYDNVDRENGVWKYFCQANLEGIPKAQGNMLPYTRFDRHPFPAVYDMLSGGKTTPEKILGDASASKESKAAKTRRLFFAHLYIGMHHEVLGEKEKALHHCRLATDNAFGRASKTYMWQVARIHYEQLAGGTFRVAGKKQKPE